MTIYVYKFMGIIIGLVMVHTFSHQFRFDVFSVFIEVRARGWIDSLCSLYLMYLCVYMYTSLTNIPKRSETGLANVVK